MEKGLINKVWNENCLSTMKRMSNNFIDLTITSPPYDQMREYEGYEFDFKSIAKELYRVTKIGGVIVWIVGDQTQEGSESLTSCKQKIFFKEECGFNIHDTMIFQKSGFNFPSNNRYHQCFDYMFILSKGKPKTFNPIKDRPNKYIQKPHGRHRGTNENDYKDLSKIVIAKYTEPFGKRYNIWYYPVGGNSNVSTDKIAHKHPAIFPESLVRDHIISWSNPKDLVYDPMLGSGTTTKVAKFLKRNYIGSEISKDYCDIAQNRLDQL